MLHKNISIIFTCQFRFLIITKQSFKMTQKFLLFCSFFLFGGFVLSSQIPELLYYKFDTPGTNVQNHATSPVGNNPATITGTGLSIGSTGLSGTALVGTGVSGTSGVINTGWMTNLSGSFTLAFWTSNITPSSTLWYIWGDAGASSLRCFTNGAAGANNWMLRGGGLPDLTITNGATTGSNMMHAVYDASVQQYRGYLNGVLVTTVSVSSTIAMSGTGFQVGAYSSNNNLNGLMDEFRIYNRALTQTEITATWNQTLGAMTDLGLQGFVGLTDSLCSGEQSIAMRMKNFGPFPLTSAKIGWKVNSTPQTVYNWSGNLASGDSTVITFGSYTFLTGTLYNIVAYINEANQTQDTLNNTNDTISKSNLFIKATPTATPNDTTLIVCPGDSVLISGTLTGLPPWNITIHDGTTNYFLNNLTTPTFSKYFSPIVTTTYSITSVSDATGCVYTGTPDIVVSALPSPPSVITPMGQTTFCEGDSVMLMASIGLNFTYQWEIDGMAAPGATGYVYTAKTAGAYTVIVTSPDGCSATSAPVNVIVHPAPPVFLGNDTNIAPGLNITLDAGPGFTSYLWSTGATSQTITIDTAGHGLGIQTIWVEVRDNNYCPGRDTIRINFVHNPGITEKYTDAIVQVIPNPTDGKFELHLEGFDPGTMNLQLYSHDSRLVYESSFVLKHPIERITVDPGRLPEGVYLLKLDRGQGTVIRRVVVSR